MARVGTNSDDRDASADSRDVRADQREVDLEARVAAADLRDIPRP